MRYLLLICSDKNQPAPSPAQMEAMVQGHGRFAQELHAAGKMVHGERLHPDADGSRVRFKAGQRQIMDGPFTETKEALGGFYLIDCENKERAIELAAQIPDTAIEGLGVEVRQVMFADGQLEA